MSECPSRVCTSFISAPDSINFQMLVDIGFKEIEAGFPAASDTEFRFIRTLFGNGDRTGNVDLATLAMNLFSYGIEPELDFSDMPKIRRIYEYLTGMKVHDRHPYAGDLVFSAFSGSHQDAIAKGMNYRKEKGVNLWTVPYLPIDPEDVGRQYDSDVIRNNSQSGKGGVAYILKQNFALSLPEKMKEEVGYMVKRVSDETHSEISPNEVYRIFTEQYVEAKPHFQIKECHFRQEGEGRKFLRLQRHDGYRPY